jgi:WD40 repeat protein
MKGGEKMKKISSVPEEVKHPNEHREEEGSIEVPANKWECLGKLDAHNSSVLSIATHANMLISTSTKSLKIWDLETSKIISDLSGSYLSGLVKYVLVHP